jgi:hypothetical protein
MATSVVGSPPDPLFRTEAGLRFRQLHRAIATGAGCDAIPVMLERARDRRANAL